MRLIKLSVIIFPVALGIGVTAFISHRIFERYSAKSSQAPPERSVVVGSRLTVGVTLSLKTSRDEYENLIRGRVLLVYLTTGCDACKKEISNISQARKSVDFKVAIYGILAEDPKNVIKFAEENHVDFPILLDQGGRILKQIGFRFMPTKVLLQDGVIIKLWYGSSPSKEALVSNILEAETQ